MFNFFVVFGVSGCLSFNWCVDRCALLRPHDLVTQRCFGRSFFVTYFLIPTTRTVVISTTIGVSRGGRGTGCDLPGNTIGRARVRRSSRGLPFSGGLS